MSDPVRPLVMIAGLEALAVLALLVADVVAVAGGTQGLAGAAQGTAVAGILLWAVIAAALGVVWLGLYRRRSLARTPFLLVQAFVLSLVPLFWGSDQVMWRVVAGVLAVVGLSGLVLGLRPSVRASLSSLTSGPAPHTEA